MNFHELPRISTGLASLEVLAAHWQFDILNFGEKSQVDARCARKSHQSQNFRVDELVCYLKYVADMRAKKVNWFSLCAVSCSLRVF